MKVHEMTLDPSGTRPPIHSPLRLEAAILSRIRSAVTSRSNCAKDSSICSVSRPMPGRGVEGLSHRDENRAGRLEPLDELCKVGEGTGQPVDLVDHNLVDETCVDVGEQALQARALQGSSREPRVLVDGWQQHPALRFLARDIRGAGRRADVVAHVSPRPLGNRCCDRLFHRRGRHGPQARNLLRARCHGLAYR